jgi:hypothetical protein
MCTLRKVVVNACNGGLISNWSSYADLVAATVECGFRCGT